jgi:hypothetical protein
MSLVVDCALGVYAVDLETDEAEPTDELPSRPPVEVALPLLLDAAASGSTIVAAVETKPPLVVSHDAGATWSESGRGLPRVHAVAASEEDPDLLAAASSDRIYVSLDGGRFWTALTVELPEIRAIAFEAAS